MVPRIFPLKIGRGEMRKFFITFFAFFVGLFPVLSDARADGLDLDTSDPLYMLSEQHVLSETTLTYWDNVLRLGQELSYGINSRLTIAANVHFQQDFDGPEDGFSAVDLGGVYRVGTAGGNSAHIISDVLFGLKVGGSSHVRTPDFADSTYYAGYRFGRQWAGMTLAATIKSSWIFDDERGMAFIDATPEAYFRIAPDWRLGAQFTLRKATNPHYNQEWLGGKIIRQYGRTQYAAHLDYEFESDDLQVGVNVNVLF